MAISNYVVDANDILHKTKVDLVKRISISPIHIVQYDQTLPIVEVELYNNYEDYVLPNNTDVFVKWTRKDNLSIYKKVLGCSSDRKKVYFAIDPTMVKYFGSITAILEIKVNEQFVDSDDEHTTYDYRIAGSSPLYFEIDKNPIQYQSIHNIIEENEDYKYLIATDIHLYEHNIFAVLEDGAISIRFNDISNKEFSSNDLSTFIAHIYDKIECSGYLLNDNIMMNVIAVSYDNETNKIKYWFTESESLSIYGFTSVSDKVRKIF